MRKILFLTVIFMSMFLGTAFSQSLSVDDKKMGESMLIYYSGNVPGIPANKAKIDEYIYGSEVVKKNAIKAFTSNVLLPIKQVELEQLKNSIGIKEAEIQSLQDAIK